jgi:4-amino-4-deoxy-L-arabinose transferase-like glycosyltransferase
MLWLGWLLITGLTISFAQGIIHSYYTVALAPAIGALVGIGGVALWSLRERAAARVALAFGVAGTAVWAAVLLSRSAEWMPALRYVVLATGIGSALAILVADRLSRRVAIAVAAVALSSAMLAPAAYSLQTASTAHTGSLPTAGPTVAGARGFGPGGGGGPQGGFGGRPGQAPPSFGGGTAPGGAAPGGTTAGGSTTGAPTGGGGMSGLLDASTPGAALTALLEQDSSSYTWVAAAVGAQTAAGYQLATGLPVASLGGFNGSDPWPTLDAFTTLVSDGQIHYFIGGGGVDGRGFGGSTGGSSVTSQISAWVAANFTAQTVDGVTVYDLTAPTSSASTS